MRKIVRPEFFYGVPTRIPSPPRESTAGTFWQVENNGHTLGERFRRREPHSASLGSHNGVLGGVVKILVPRTFYKLVCYNFTFWRDVNIYCASHGFILW